MPALKSPGTMLKVLNKAKTDYVKNNSVKELAPQEQFHFNKVTKGLTQLRTLAQQQSSGTGVADADLVGARDPSVEQLDKLRKLFKPKKSQGKVKPFYQTVCRLILSLEQLGSAGELDASEAEAQDGALDDLDAEALDKRDEPRDAGIAAKIEKNGVTTAPPLPPAAQTPPAPVNEAARWAQRSKALEPELLTALREQRGDTSRMRAVFAFAQEKAGTGDYVKALQGLDSLEKLVRAASAAPQAPPLEAAAVAPAADAQAALASWQQARTGAVNQLRELAKRCASSTHPEAMQAVILINSIMKNLTPQPARRQQVLELERYLTQDDVVSDACLAYDIRTPLVEALTDLKAQLPA